MWRSLNNICNNTWVKWAVHKKNAFTELQFFTVRDFSFNIWLFYRCVLDYVSPFLYLLSAGYLLWIFSTVSHRSTCVRHCFSPFCLSISSSESWVTEIINLCSHWLADLWTWMRTLELSRRLHMYFPVQIYTGVRLSSFPFPTSSPCMHLYLHSYHFSPMLLWKSCLSVQPGKIVIT